MSTYEVEYQVHESQVPKDEWTRLTDMGEVEAHQWFDRMVEKQGDLVAIRVVRIDRTVIRSRELAAAPSETAEEPSHED